LIKHLAEIATSEQENWDICERMTGKGKEEWELEFGERVQRALGGQWLTSRRNYTLEKIIGLCKYYGLDYDEFVEQIVVSYDRAEMRSRWEQGAEMAGWPGHKESGYCNMVMRYRFKSEALAKLG